MLRPPGRLSRRKVSETFSDLHNLPVRHQSLCAPFSPTQAFPKYFFEDLEITVFLMCRTVLRGALIRRPFFAVCDGRLETPGATTLSYMNQLKTLPKPIKSWLKVAAAAALAALLADGADVIAVSWSDLRTYLSIALAAVLPLAITYLDPSDERWGKTEDAANR